MPFPYDLVTFSCFGTLVDAGGRAAEELPADLPGAPFPEVPASLRRLANRIPIGLLSNAGSAGLRACAEQLLAVPISVLISADEAGSRKPEPGHWCELLRSTRLAAARILHVSAWLQRDLLPASRLGFPVALLERGGVQAAGAAPLRHRAADLRALVASVLAEEQEIEVEPVFAELPYPREYLVGVSLFNQRRYYEAHEVWEDAWKTGLRGSADFYKSLIQYAVAALHWERGNAAGAERLYREARRLLTPYVPAHLGLDVVAFLQTMEDYFEPLLAARERGAAAPGPRRAAAPRIHLEG